MFNVECWILHSSLFTQTSLHFKIKNYGKYNKSKGRGLSQG